MTFEELARIAGAGLKADAAETYGEGTTVSEFMKAQWLKWDEITDFIGGYFEDAGIDAYISEDGDNDVWCGSEFMCWKDFKKLVKKYSK